MAKSFKKPEKWEPLPTPNSSRWPTNGGSWQATHESEDVRDAYDQQQRS